MARKVQSSEAIQASLQWQLRKLREELAELDEKREALLGLIESYSILLRLDERDKHYEGC